MVLIRLNDVVIPCYVSDEFPSPCGDYGSYQQEPTRTYTALLFMFPSPCGDYGSYLAETENEP